MSKLTLELTTPERTVLKDEYDSLTLPTETGEITVLPGHVPLVANLASGTAVARKGREETYLAVSGGFVEVRGDGRVILLADTAERAEELDLEALEAAKARAEKLLTETRQADDVSSAAAYAALERELARIRTVRTHRARKNPTPHQDMNA